jgi:hypothetical protein
MFAVQYKKRKNKSENVNTKIKSQFTVCIKYSNAVSIAAENNDMYEADFTANLYDF